METKMKSKSQQLLCDHYKTIFGEGPAFSLKLKQNVFKPTEEMTFWKSCTIGASDYLMPERDTGWDRKANRGNEHMMLIAPDVKVSEDAAEWLFLDSLLWYAAEYAFNEKDAITVSGTINMGIEGKYCGFVLLLPKVFKTSSVVKCYHTKQKYISIFQVMPITRELISKKLQKGTNGIYWLMEYFYTHDDDCKLIESKPFCGLINSLI